MPNPDRIPFTTLSWSAIVKLVQVVLNKGIPLETISNLLVPTGHVADFAHSTSFDGSLTSLYWFQPESGSPQLRMTSTEWNAPAPIVPPDTEQTCVSIDGLDSPLFLSDPIAIEIIPNLCLPLCASWSPAESAEVVLTEEQLQQLLLHYYPDIPSSLLAIPFCQLAFSLRRDLDDYCSEGTPPYLLCTRLFSEHRELTDEGMVYLNPDQAGSPFLASNTYSSNPNPSGALSVLAELLFAVTSHFLLSTTGAQLVALVRNDNDFQVRPIVHTENVLSDIFDLGSNLAYNYGAPLSQPSTAPYSELPTLPCIPYDDLPYFYRISGFQQACALLLSHYQTTKEAYLIQSLSC